MFVIQVSRPGRQEHGADQGADTDRGAARAAAQQGAAQAGGHDGPPQACQAGQRGGADGSKNFV